MTQRPEPSPEVKKIIGEFCRIQREKHGENWKSILAAEMAAKTTPVLQALLKLQKSK